MNEFFFFDELSTVTPIVPCVSLPADEKEMEMLVQFWSLCSSVHIQSEQPSVTVAV